MKSFKITKSLIEILDNLPVFILASDKDFNIQFWNRALEKATGYKKDEVIGNRGIIEKFYPDPIERKEKLKKWKNENWKGKTWETKIFTKYGTPLYIIIHEISEYITSDEDILWGVGIDITELKKVQERYKTYIELTAEGIWYFSLDEPVDTTLPADEQLKLLFERAYLAECNSSYAKMYGFSSPSEIVGVRLKDIMPPDDEENIKYLKMVIKNDYFVRGMESVEYDREGKKRYFLNNLMGIKDGKYIIGAWGSQVDITEFKKVEEELKDKERLITNILNSVKGYIWKAEVEKDGNFKFLYLSPTIKNITGFSFDEIIEAYKKSGNEELKEQNKRLAYSAIKEAMEKGEASFDFKMYRKSGKPVYLRNIISVEKSNKEGKFIVNGFGFDVTEFKKLSDKLKESEKFYLEILNTIPDAFFLHDVDGKVVEVNETALKMYNATKDDIIGFGVEKFSGKPFTKKDVGEKIDYVLRNGYAEFEWVGKKMTGEEFPEKVRLKRVEIVGTPYIMALVTDISSEKKAIEELKASEERFRKLAENPLVGMAIIKDRKFVFVNQKLADIFGYRVDEVVNKLGPLDLTVPEERKKVLENLKAREEGRIKSIEYSLKGLKKTGERVNVRVFGSLLDTEKDRSIAAIIIDETEKIKAEERKRELEEQLFQSQKLEAIGLLAAGIAHDFNNVLGGILGYASYIKNLYKDDEKLISKIELIEKAAVKASDLTNKLLGFARKGKYTETIIDVGKAVKSVIAILQRTIPKRIKVETYLPEKTLFIKGDENQIEQVVLNLSTNAVDAMKEKGVLKISVEAVDVSEDYADRHIDAETGKYVRVTVEDTGEGIPDEIKDRIFEPFFTTKPPGKGTGLGLSMVYGIVKNHGGFITLYSEVGKGTTFRIYLPQVDVEEKLKKKKEKELTLKGRKRKVMVVDDEEIIREVLKDMLETLNFEVVLASNGKEAIDKYTEDIELVFIDMNMPEMGGKETFYALKGKYPDVKAIVCTGYSLDYNTRELLRNGAKGFLHKPFNMEELKKKIKEALEE